MSVEKRKSDALALIHAIYEAAEATSKLIDLNNVHDRAQLSMDEAEAAAVYLIDRHLVEEKSWPLALVRLTREGINEVDAAMSKPNESTEHFPAPVNVINVGYMSRSSIQQAGAGSQQKQEIEYLEIDEIANLGELVKQYRRRLDEQPDVDPEGERDADAELHRVESELSSPRPRRAIVMGSLSTLWTLSQNIAANFATEGLLHYFKLFGFG